MAIVGVLLCFGCSKARKVEDPVREPISIVLDGVNFTIPYPTTTSRYVPPADLEILFGLIQDPRKKTTGSFFDQARAWFFLDPDQPLKELGAHPLKIAVVSEADLEGGPQWSIEEFEQLRESATRSVTEDLIGASLPTNEESLASVLHGLLVLGRSPYPIPVEVVGTGVTHLITLSAQPPGAEMGNIPSLLSTSVILAKGRLVFLRIQIELDGAETIRDIREMSTDWTEAILECN